MNKPTIEDWMKLIAELTGYHDNLSRVSMGHMPKRKYNDWVGSEGLDYNDWGWTASTEICTHPEKITVSAEGKTQIKVLEKLASCVVERLKGTADHWIQRELKSRAAFDKFQKRFSLL